VPVQFRQLLPEAATVEVEHLLGSLEFAARAPEDRPLTMVNFVASADGRATVKGRSGGLGDDGDRAMFHGLRERVDAVLAGTRTLRTEGYGRILAKAERRQRRVELGLAPEPLACIVTRSGDVPTEIDLFAEPEARILVFSPIQPDLGGSRAEVRTVEVDPAQPIMTAVLRHLRVDFGVRSVLCEGGPTLFGALLSEQVVDELFLTLAPSLTGGGNGPTITTGAELPEPAALRIEWALEREGALYLRYALRQSL
jgi:riboflavin biosynthesis pyrimidine reductase